MGEDAPPRYSELPQEADLDEDLLRASGTETSTLLPCSSNDINKPLTSVESTVCCSIPTYIRRWGDSFITVGRRAFEYYLDLLSHIFTPPVLALSVFLAAMITIAVKAYTHGGIWVMGVAVSWWLCAGSIVFAGMFEINPMPIFFVGFLGFGFSGMMSAFSEAGTPPRP